MGSLYIGKCIRSDRTLRYVIYKNIHDAVAGIRGDRIAALLPQLTLPVPGVTDPFDPAVTVIA